MPCGFLPDKLGGLLEIVNAEAPTHTLGSEFLLRVFDAATLGLRLPIPTFHSTEISPLTHLAVSKCH